LPKRTILIPYTLISLISNVVSGKLTVVKILTSESRTHLGSVQ